MLQLVILLRASQLYLHHAHLLAKGALFMQDHAHLSDLYNEMESEFDSVCERMIGLDKEVELNLQTIMKSVNEKLASCNMNVKENKEYFQKQLQFEAEIRAKVEELVKAGGISQGTIQMLGDVANKSEIRTYKLKRRIK